MAHNVVFAIALGAGNTGLTLSAQVRDVAGTAVGGAVTTGFYEIGQGNYSWNGSIVDGQAGSVSFSSAGVVKAAAAINGAETENADVRTSTRVVTGGVVGSVTGSVGSVTGNVGGNVAGSVASVTAAVDILQSAADKVWGTTVRSLTTFGTLVADTATAVWAAVTRTLTSGGGLTAPQVSAAVWDEPRASHLVAGTFGLGAQIPRTGTAQAGSATSITLDTGAAALDNYYANMLIYLAAGTGAGQSLFVLGYVGATKVATMNGVWVTPPDNTTAFVLLPFASLMGGASLTAAAIWAYVSRTLTQAIAAVVPPPLIQGTTVTVRRGDTWVLPFTGLGSLVGRSKLWLTIKSTESDTDLMAVVQIEETGGLLRLGGAAATSGQGSLVVTDPNAGNLTVTLAAVATSLLAPGTHYYYDLQVLVGTTVQTLTTGAWAIISDVTESIS